MPTKIKEVQPPRGMARRFYRLPIWLFRLHLGWLLKGHFLLLTHTGRKSDLPRQKVLEVLWHEKAVGAYYVLAGWGEQSDWVKNIEKTPQVTIAIGRRWFRARASSLLRPCIPSGNEKEDMPNAWKKRGQKRLCVKHVE